jgi:hypothetical protein
MPPLWQYFARLHFEADFDGHEPEHVEGILDIGSTHVTLDTSNDGSLVGLIRTRCCGVLGAGRKPGHRKNHGRGCSRMAVFGLPSRGRGNTRQEVHMRHRMPIIVSAAALVVAVLGVTPFGQAAGQAVQHAVFAEDAANVNGLEASSTPRPNALLALDAKAKFPASVIPTPAKRTTQFFLQTLGAIVRSDGTIVRSFPAGAVTSTRLATGRYRITFNRNVRDCLQLATIRTFLIGEDEPIAEHIHVAVTANPNAILVEMTSSGQAFLVESLPAPVHTVTVATPAGPANSGFNVAVLCSLFPFPF